MVLPVWTPAVLASIAGSWIASAPPCPACPRCPDCVTAPSNITLTCPSFAAPAQSFVPACPPIPECRCPACRPCSGEAATTPVEPFLDVRRLLEALAQFASAVLTLFACSALAFVCGFLAGKGQGTLGPASPRKQRKALVDRGDLDLVVTPSTRRAVKG